MGPLARGVYVHQNPIPHAPRQSAPGKIHEVAQQRPLSSTSAPIRRAPEVELLDRIYAKVPPGKIRQLVVKRPRSSASTSASGRRTSQVEPPNESNPTTTAREREHSSRITKVSKPTTARRRGPRMEGYTMSPAEKMERLIRKRRRNSEEMEIKRNERQCKREETKEGMKKELMREKSEQVRRSRTISDEDDE